MHAYTIATGEDDAQQWTPLQWTETQIESDRGGATAMEKDGVGLAHMWFYDGVTY